MTNKFKFGFASPKKFFKAKTLVQSPATKPNSAPLNSETPTSTPDNKLNLVNCRICGRHFTEDRISKHEQICEKVKENSKRQPFDTLKQRMPDGVSSHLSKSTVSINLF